MRRRIYLYIADQLVDLQDQSFILFNYAMEDLSNPTIVKNSYSQQITLKGTPANNRIFGGMWRTDRVTQYNGTQVGIDFDPAQKTPFTIYNEMNELLQTGYVKLDKVTVNRGMPEYTISLYGGLGAFFYGLAYDANGNKRTLADVKYTGSSATDSELSFVINKSNVLAAWNRLSGAGTTGIWDYINFAPAYNGLPTGLFDSDKALVNTSLAGLTIPSGYGDTSGYVLATLPKQYTEWETKDLRSYLQRPVLSVRRLFVALAQSYNNGGYHLVLDDDFFNSSNPYYYNAWITLPIINTLDVQISEGSGILSQATDITIPSGGNVSTKYTASVKFKPHLDVALVSGPYYMHCTETWTQEGEEGNRIGYYMNYITYTLTAYDSNSTVIQSRSLTLSTRQTEGQGNVPVIDMVGSFSSVGGWEGDYVEFTIEGMGISRLVLTTSVTAATWGDPSHGGDILSVWTDPNDFDTLATVNSYLQNSWVGWYKYVTSESARSGVTITKQMLLSSDKTPADYLLSYCKMFGLTFRLDAANNEVNIEMKKNFYQDNVIDLTGRVNQAYPVTMLPFAFTSKWYDFYAKYENGAYAKYYANIYDRVFGLQRVNTGYAFNADAVDVMADVVYKGACDVLESSKYYVDIVNNYNFIPAVFLDAGGSYALRTNSGDTEEFDIPLPPSSASKTYYNTTYKTYDIFPKVQFHEGENEAYEERDTLLFFSGMQNISSVTGRYALTDDTSLMMAMNDNTPCWILDDQEVNTAYRITSLPRFSRYYWSGSSIVHSFDFGTPGEVSVPDAAFLTGSSIYETYWQTYLADRYDDDSRVMTCRVNLAGMQVNESLLRNFYYYKGCLWVLNRIINHSLTTWDDTECEFIKVQDKDHYLIG